MDKDRSNDSSNKEKLTRPTIEVDFANSRLSLLATSNKLMGPSINMMERVFRREPIEPYSGYDKPAGAKEVAKAKPPLRVDQVRDMQNALDIQKDMESDARKAAEQLHDSQAQEATQSPREIASDIPMGEVIHIPRHNVPTHQEEARAA